MDEEQNRTPLGIELLRGFGTVFTTSILVMCFAGMLIARRSGPRVMSTLFSSGAGLSFNTILQLAAFALITAVLAVLFFSERFFKKTRFICRLLFFFLLTTVEVSVLAVIFKWFPINKIHNWIVFILLFIAGSTIGLGFTMLKLKLEKKKYGKLLAAYKSQHK